MKIVLPYSSFNKATKTITFSISNFDIKNLYAVIDVTNQTLVYAASIAGKGYASYTTSTLVLQYDTNTVAFNNTDQLVIIYEQALSLNSGIVDENTQRVVLDNATITTLLSIASQTKQDTQIGILDDIYTVINNIATGKDTLNVNIVSGGGSTGGATEVTLATILANQTNNTQSTKILDSNGATIVKGSNTMTNSLPFTLATDDGLQTKIGNVTETAPTTDTASSGLNGRLQRIAQRLTSFIALFPASIGVKTAAGSLSTTLASDDAQIGVDNTGITQVNTGTGIRGWLSGIYKRLTDASTNTTSPFTKLTDGVNNATIKATLVSATSSDTSFVTQENPNSQANSNYTLIGAIGNSAINANLFESTLNSTAATNLTTYSTLINTSANAKQWNSFNCLVVGGSGISAGAVIFEGSNDDIIYFPIPVALNNTTTLLTAANTIGSNSNQYFKGNIDYKFIKCRISTAFVGGTVKVITTLSPQKYDLFDTVKGAYNFTAPTLLNGQTAPLQLDVNGKLQTVANLGATIYIPSTGNNTAVQLAAATTFTGTIESALSYPQVIISTRCDQPYTLTIDQFSDAAGTIQYSPSIVYTRSAGVAFNQSINLAGSYYRTKITNNGVSATTTLFSESFLGILPPLPNLDNNGNLPVASSAAADGTGISTQNNIVAADIASTTVVGTNSQSIITGTPTTNSFSNFALSTAEGIKLQVTGTFVATLNSEVSIDGGTTWTPIMINQTGMNTFVNSFTAGINGNINVSGCTNFRIRCTSYTSGSPIIKIVTTANIGSVQMSNSMTGASAGVPVAATTLSITAANTAQTLFAANTSRGGYVFQNTSAFTLYIDFTGTASAASLPVLPNQEYMPPIVTTGAVSVFGGAGTTGAAFLAFQWNGVPSSQIGVANAGIVAAGGLPTAQSLSVVPATDIYKPLPVYWTAIVAGTGYVIGDVLQQSFNLTSTGTLTDKWINITQKTVIATITPATISTTLKISSMAMVGATTANASMSVVGATNATDSVQKEWKVVTVTGTPAASVGDILMQTIKNNGGVVSTTWFNMTQSVLFTVVPTVANLTENSNKGGMLLGTQNGRQNWAAFQATGSTATSGSLMIFATSTDGGANTASLSTYTVPAGKRLRILNIDFSYVPNLSIAAGSIAFQDMQLKQDTITPILASPNIFAMRLGHSNVMAAAGVGGVPNGTFQRSFTDGAIDIASGQIIGLFCTNASAAFAYNFSMNGYLYNN